MARPRQVSDEQILASMREAVLADGPGVSLEQVASHLKVSAPALLKRFGSRQALMLAALRPADNPAWIEQLAQGPGEGGLEEQLSSIFLQISEFMSDAIPCVVALRESGIPSEQLFPKSQHPERGLRAMQRWLKLAKQMGLVTAPELDTAAFAMLGALQTRAFFNHLMKREFPRGAQRQYVAELARLFTRTLAP
jgi:AcrR family transcriptional regulator